MLSAGLIPHNGIHLFYNYYRFCHTSLILWDVVFIITSFLAGVESADQCLLNSKVLSCFSCHVMCVYKICA